MRTHSEFSQGQQVGTSKHAINAEAMPDELKALSRWVCHKNKVPYQPDGTPAKSNMPETWATFEDCFSAYESGPYEGIGFVLGDGYAGVDLDHCVKEGIVSPFAQGIVEQLHSYTELSPSGEGLHVICRGKLPSGARKREDIGLEMYDEARYFTMTGTTHREFSNIRDCAQELRDIHRRYMSQDGGSSASDALSEYIYKGARNNTLTSVAGSMRHRGMAYGTILSILLSTNTRLCIPPLSDAEVQRIARSVSRYDSPESDTLEYEYTDLGDARYILAETGDLLRHIHPSKPKESGIWYAWSGARWEYAGYGLTRSYIRSGLEHRAQELRNQAISMACRDEKASKEARKHSKRLGSSSKIEAVLKMLSTFEELQTSYEQFDAEPYDLNCKNGIIDLKDGGIRPHDPSSFLSKITDVPFVPDGIAPKWEKFISDITQGDDELSAYLQRAAGYSLTGAFPEHAFFMLVGSRRNGKTTFLEILRRCMGDYAVTVQVGALMERRSSDLNPDIPKLRGARFCTTSETESNQRLGLGLVKALTGGGTIAGRELYMGPVEFTPYVKLWMDTNSPPYMSPRDKGTWARAQIIPFDRCFEGQEDPNLRQKLLHELPGILKWMVQGAGARLDEGLNTPQIVRDKTAEIRGEQNTVKGFIEDVCEERNFDQLRVEDTKHTTLPEAPLVDLYEEYVLWCHASGCRELSKREFVKELESMGHEKTEGRGHARMIRGLLIVDSMKNSKE